MGDDTMANEHSGHERHAGHGGHTALDSHSGPEEHETQHDHQRHAGHAGHGGHGNHAEQFRKLFWIMLIISVPVVAFSPMFAHLIGYQVPGWTKWISPILGTVMYGWGGAPFLTGAVSELKSRRPGMMMLISLAITVAFFASWGASLGILDHELDFWWELALLIVIMLLGHWMEMRALAQTTSALDSLAALLPDEAERVDGQNTVMVAPADLEVGDIVVVRPGGRVPADGRILEGSADMDESMITGESHPVRRGPDQAVVAGTVATDSGLRIEVTAVGADTALAGIQQLVEAAQASSSRAQRIADRAAALLFWFALGSGVLTLVVWTLLGMPDEGIVRAITVLVIACPHALGLAIPLVVAIATERAARAGILVKDRLALEKMRMVNIVLFDKTGTLTKGTPVVTAVEAVAGFTTDRVLSLAAAAEADSEHPSATAIRAAAAEKGLEVPRATDFVSMPAVGVKAQVENVEVQVGGPYLLEQERQQEMSVADSWREEGATILHVLVGGDVAGAISLQDEVRAESTVAVQALHDLGIEAFMVTGDAEAVAVAVAEETGVDRVFSGVRPEEKASRVEGLQQDKKIVAMVGDGVNDAPALAQADVGIAIGAGTDVAIASAGVILVSDDPRSVLSIIKLSNATYRKMKQNLWWAGGYNLLAVPLAAGVLAPIGFILPMSVGAILMSLSTMVVALNAQTLRRLDLRPGVVTAAAMSENVR